MKIEQLNHMALHVKDLEKSVDFYQNILGLPPIPRPAFNFPGAWFGIGAHEELHLIVGREDTMHFKSRGTHFALRVTSIAETEAYLKEKGVPYQPLQQRPDGAWQIYVTDPDGYSIELCELV